MVENKRTEAEEIERIQYGFLKFLEENRIKSKYKKYFMDNPNIEKVNNEWKDNFDKNWMKLEKYTDFPPQTYISNAFFWRGTEEGYDYWMKQDYRWMQELVKLLQVGR